MSMSLGSIAAVLPLVGGIGIMNIMLVSVTANARKKIFLCKVLEIMSSHLLKTR